MPVPIVGARPFPWVSWVPRNKSDVLFKTHPTITTLNQMQECKKMLIHDIFDSIFKENRWKRKEQKVEGFL